MNPPAATYLLDNYRYSWKDEGVDVIVDRLHDERDGLKCELTISTSVRPSPGMLREGNFNLMSATTRSQWVKDLDKRMDSVDWYAVMESVCALSKRRWREGVPIVDLAEVEPSLELPYIYYPLMIDGAASVLFADGASGKSMIAIAVALSIATGEEIIPGFQPVRCGPVIYFDWEWDAESHKERMAAVCAGAGIALPTQSIYYQREVTSLLDALPRMRKRVAETGAVAAIIDSLGFARGGEPNSADLTTRTFTGLRTLEIPTLVLDHVAKDAKDSTHSFGSTYTFNAARMMWRIDVSKEEGQDDFYTALVNTKSNRKLQRSKGLDIQIETDESERLLSVRFLPTDLRDLSELTAKALPLADQIESVILANKGVRLHHKDITTILQAEGSKVTEDVVRVILYSRKRRFVKLGEGWGLLAAEGVTGGL